MARTKTEYREYIGSTEWQQRRKEFLVTHDKCAKCRMPRCADYTYEELTAAIDRFITPFLEFLGDEEAMYRRVAESFKKMQGVA